MSRREMLIGSLGATVQDLIRVLRPVSADVSLRSAAPDDWSIADIVAHLAYVEPLFLARLQRIASEDHPRVPSIDPDRSAHDTSQPLGALLQAFILRRAATVAFLQGLEQRDWARKVTHETMGEGRLRDHVQLLVDHDSNHLQQIVALREWLEKE